MQVRRELVIDAPGADKPRLHAAEFQLCRRTNHRRVGTVELATGENNAAHATGEQPLGVRQHRSPDEHEPPVTTRARVGHIARHEGAT